MFNVAKLLVNYEAAGINKALETFMSNDVTTSKRESLMVQYGCTPGDPGGEVRYDTKLANRIKWSHLRQLSSFFRQFMCSSSFVATNRYLLLL